MPPGLTPGANVLPPNPAIAGAVPIVVSAAVDAARSRMLENRDTMNGFDVEIQKKFALSAACIVFVLIGAPIALRFPRGGVGLVIGVSLIVFAIYYVGLIAGESLANKDIIPPFWAMWAANIIMTIIGVVMMIRMGREGATARGGDLSEFLEAIRTALGRVGRRIGLPLERRHQAT
jgi:lipopolysaccharide export system permease protein